MNRAKDLHRRAEFGHVGWNCGQSLDALLPGWSILLVALVPQSLVILEVILLRPLAGGDAIAHRSLVTILRDGKRMPKKWCIADRRPGPVSLALARTRLPPEAAEIGFIANLPELLTGLVHVELGIGVELLEPLLHLAPGGVVGLHEPALPRLARGALAGRLSDVDERALRQPLRRELVLVLAVGIGEEAGRFFLRRVLAATQDVLKTLRHEPSLPRVAERALQRSARDWLRHVGRRPRRDGDLVAGARSGRRPGL